MKKDQKFLNELNDKLGNINQKKKETIMSKYKKIINDEKKNGKKITEIIKSFGNIDDIVKKEVESINQNSLKSKIKRIFKRDKTNKKESKIKKFEDKVNAFEESFNAKFTFKNKNNKKVSKEVKKVTENIKESYQEIKNDIKSEISEVSSIPTTRNILETKSERKHRIIVKTLKVVLILILLFFWLWSCVAFMAGLFAIMDGIKIYGVNIILFAVMLFALWALLLVNKTLFKKKINKLFWYISLILIIFILAIGIALTAYKISKIKTIKDVSEKYNFSRKYEEYNLPQNENKKFYIYFNGNYNTKYEYEYSDTLNGKIAIEVKYYECYYNFYNKKGNHNVYISLKQDYRDKLSVYIENLKDNKIYDSDELSRYTVKIIGNKKDLERVVVN